MTDEKTFADILADMPVAMTKYITQEEWAKMGPQATYIVTVLAPEFIDKFINANAHYGETNADVLGEKGQFAEIWRKVGPLKRALWDGLELTREQPREILMDLIGHCLLTIEMLDRQAKALESGPVRLDGDPVLVPVVDAPDISAWGDL